MKVNWQETREALSNDIEFKKFLKKISIILIILVGVSFYLSNVNAEKMLIFQDSKSKEQQYKDFISTYKEKNKAYEELIKNKNVAIAVSKSNVDAVQADIIEEFQDKGINVANVVKKKDKSNGKNIDKKDDKENEKKDKKQTAKDSNKKTTGALDTIYDASLIGKWGDVLTELNGLNYKNSLINILSIELMPQGDDLDQVKANVKYKIYVEEGDAK